MSDRLSYADIEWKESVPCSKQFGDIYFSREGGENETQHVFIDGNNLKARFPKVSDHFTIIESGFGTGLNFLVTATLWKKIAPQDAILHFISTEKYPLAPDDFAKALSFFPQFEDLARELVAHYPPLCRGFHRLYFEREKIQLTLLYGDIQQTLPQLQAKADAWFLDGFAPAKNNDMWNEKLFNQIARLSKSDTTIATYSAAGAVRRALTDRGFHVEKTKGFGHKRDMVKATSTPLATNTNRKAPEEKKAIIIGAGLAGCFAAHSLASRGFDITLIDRNDSICNEASGNRFGILQPAITAPEDIGGRFHLAGFLHSTTRLSLHQVPHHPTGAIHLSHKREGKEHILPDGWLTKNDHNDKGYYLNQSCYLSPHQFAEIALKQHGEAIKTIFHCTAITLHYNSHEWSVLDQHGHATASAPIVIIANANDANAFSETSWLPLQAVRGQLSYIPANKKSRSLSKIICHDSGYILPADEHGMHVVGATYEPFLDNLELLEISHQRNLEGFVKVMGATPINDINNLEGRVSFRCTSRDRMPFVGPVTNINTLETAFTENTELACHEGLYVSVAHGSRGLSSTPLSGEILASYITGEPLPIELDILRRIHPSRWPHKQLKQGKRFTS